ncbi:MAG: hypothetical protein ABH828_02195 [archaeon]
MLCSKCNHGMKEVDRMNSGNSVFVKYQCLSCQNNITKATGLSNLSTI